MSIVENALRIAEPYMKENALKVEDVVVGLHYVAVLLNDGRCHVAYMMHEDLPAIGTPMPGFNVIGEDAFKVASLAKTGTNDVQRSIGFAALNAASPYYDDAAYNMEESELDIPEGTVMGMIGFMPPKIAMYKDKVSKILCFDRGIEHNGEQRSIPILPMEKEKELLPECGALISTGTAFLNSTIDDILSWSTSAVQVEMNGWSVLFWPPAYEGTPVTHINTARYTGTWEELSRDLSRGGNIACIAKHSKHIFYKFPEKEKQDE